MSELRKANTNYPYFITLTVVGWIDLFTRAMYCDFVIHNLNYCIKNKGLEVFSYCIMPSHIHLIARDEKGSLNNTLRDFKSFTSKQIIHHIETSDEESRRDWLLHLFKFHAKYQKQNSKYMLWQKTNFPIELSDNAVFDQKLAYTQNNPVASGLVNAPENWTYSSASMDNKVLLAEI